MWGGLGVSCNRYGLPGLPPISGWADSPTQHKGPPILKLGIQSSHTYVDAGCENDERFIVPTCPRRVNVGTPVSYPVPQTESRRLEALRSCGVLDTAPHPAFDALSRLASRICQTPIAAVVLIDRDRQWFKSAIGVEARQTPREVSFCAHAIMSSRPLVVRDATQDSRLAFNPLVTGEPGLRSYIGVPLVLDDQHTVGTICVADTKVRDFTRDQIEVMELLATQAVELLLHARADREVARMDAELAHVRHQLSAVLDACSVGMFLASANGEAYYFNRAWEKLAGMTATEARQGGWAPRLHAQDREKIVDGWIGAVADRKPFLCGARFVHPDGKVVHIDASCQPFFEGNTLAGYVGTVVDVSAQRVAEGAMQLLLHHQDSANTLLETQKKQVEDMIALLAHDLQSPLTAAAGQLAIADQAAHRGVDPRTALTKARASLKGIEAMVEGLLGFAKAGKEQIQTAPVQVGTIVREVADECREAAHDNGIAIELCITEASGAMDATSLRRCVRNLIDNAIKHMPPDAPTKAIRVSVRAGDLGPCVTIEDSGAGIEQSLRVAAFDPYRRGVTKAAGTGLGLATVKRYVEAAGGTVWLEESDLGGLKATFVIPASVSVQPRLAA